MTYRFARWLYRHVNPDVTGFRHIGPVYIEQITGLRDTSYLLLVGQRALTIWTDAIMLSQHKGENL